MNLDNPKKSIQIEQPRSLYKWAKVWNATQRKFFVEDVKLRREKQIEDFIVLNGFRRVHFIIDTDVFIGFDTPARVDTASQADIVVVTDQKFSRYPCTAMIDKIEHLLSQCPHLYLCLNRHYINIDNSYIDKSLSDNFCLAVAQWLSKSLPNHRVIDLGQDYLDIGQSFTWALPDRHYYITSK